MTVVTTPDSKVKTRAKETVAKTSEQRAQEREDAAAKKQRLNAAVASTVDQINTIIEALADEHNIPFDHACNLVHLGGHVFKERRRPTIQNAYRYCAARVDDGRWEVSASTGLKAEAIRIITDSRKRGGDYRGVTEVDQVTLIQLLQDNRDLRETGVVDKPQLQLHDVRTTMAKVGVELANLHQRSGLEYILIGGRSDADQWASPFTQMSHAGGTFIKSYLKFDPPVLAKRFDAFSVGGAGIAGIVRTVAAEEHGGDTKSATKSVVMPLLRKAYRELVKRESVRLDWTAWANGEPDCHGIIIEGWPLDIPPINLSKIRTVEEMNKILYAVEQNEFKFKFAEKEPQPVIAAQVTDTYQRGGTVISLTGSAAKAKNPPKKKGVRGKTEAKAKKRKTASVVDSDSESDSDEGQLRADNRGTSPKRARTRSTVAPLDDTTATNALPSGSPTLDNPGQLRLPSLQPPNASGMNFGDQEQAFNGFSLPPIQTVPGVGTTMSFSAPLSDNVDWSTTTSSQFLPGSLSALLASDAPLPNSCGLLGTGEWQSHGDLGNGL
ncbi:hypothetical protein BC834DRAFT_974061 [Gloeopeniophorella convolvens]|nr:hypothetical protein BC834DRAFT_974061 [Gloeopeniophorella convolvens]